MVATATDAEEDIFQASGGEAEEGAAGEDNPAAQRGSPASAPEAPAPAPPEHREIDLDALAEEALLKHPRIRRMLAQTHKSAADSAYNKAYTEAEARIRQQQAAERQAKESESEEEKTLAMDDYELAQKVKADILAKRAARPHLTAERERAMAEGAGEGYTRAFYELTEELDNFEVWRSLHNNQRVVLINTHPKPGQLVAAVGRMEAKLLAEREAGRERAALKEAAERESRATQREQSPTLERGHEGAPPATDDAWIGAYARGENRDHRRGHDFLRQMGLV